MCEIDIWEVERDNPRLKVSITLRYDRQAEWHCKPHLVSRNDGMLIVILATRTDCGKSIGAKPLHRALRATTN